MENNKERKVIQVNKILIAVMALVLAVPLCYAAEEAKPMATEPVGAVVETGGVIIGKVTTVIEESLGGGKTKGSLVLAEDNGKTKMIPLDSTVKVLDAAFHAITLDKLNGRKVSVETSKEGTAKKIQEVK
ncbi:MAG: hypothetical protein Q8Q87_00640 [Candidatus Omnitrophota bacterium]|nr:hypothetical protein [Candidatus Omnitrophota bacterium]